MKRIFGVTGWKNSGKTWLTTRLVENLTSRGIGVSTVKHAHHGADVDREGTDSFKHRAAGAREVMLATPHRFALMHELRPGEDEPPLDALLARMEDVDLILIEGFKRDAFPKIMAHRREGAPGKPGAEIPGVVALAADDPDAHADAAVPVFHIDDIEAIADFILVHVGLKREEGAA